MPGSRLAAEMIRVAGPTGTKPALTSTFRDAAFPSAVAALSLRSP